MPPGGGQQSPVRSQPQEALQRGARQHHQVIKGDLSIISKLVLRMVLCPQSSMAMSDRDKTIACIIMIFQDLECAESQGPLPSVHGASHRLG